MFDERAADRLRHSESAAAHAREKHRAVVAVDVMLQDLRLEHAQRGHAVCDPVVYGPLMVADDVWRVVHDSVARTAVIRDPGPEVISRHGRVVVAQRY